MCPGQFGDNCHFGCLMVSLLSKSFAQYSTWVMANHWSLPISTSFLDQVLLKKSWTPEINYPCGSENSFSFHFIVAFFYKTTVWDLVATVQRCVPKSSTSNYLHLCLELWANVGAAVWMCVQITAKTQNTTHFIYWETVLQTKEHTVVPLWVQIKPIR